VWRILDARDHGDILKAMGLELLWVACPTCATRTQVESPLLVIRLGSSAPLLLAAPLAELRDGRAQQYSADLMDQARNAGAFPTVSLPLVPIPLPCSLLPVVLSRDIDRDVTDREFARSQLAAHDAATATQYDVFLNHLAWHRDARISTLLQAVIGSWPSQMMELIDTHPELTNGTTVRDAGCEELRAAAGGELEAGLRIRQQLLEELCDGHTPHTVAVQRYCTALESHGRDMRTRLHAMYRAAMDAEGPEGFALTRDALVFAAQLGEEPIATDLAISLGESWKRIAHNSSGAELLEADLPAVVAALESMLARLPEGSVPGVLVANILAMMFSLRQVGDRVEDWEKARRLYAAAALIDRSAHPDLWSMIQTNYGLHLSERPGGGSAAVTEGITHIRAGLEERSVERGVVDWAYSMTNLALLLQRRGQSGDSILAQQYYRDVLDHLGPDEQPELWSQVQINLAELLLKRDDTDVQGAQDALSAALEFWTSHGTGDPARIKWLLARVIGHRQGHESTDSIRLRREALAAAPARLSPRLHLQIAEELIKLLAYQQRWSDVADVASDMVVAMEALYDAQVTSVGRRAAISYVSRLTRWAVFALARAGRPERAVEVLERGLACEFSLTAGRDTAELDSLEQADPTIAGRYRKAVAHYRVSIAEPTMVGAPAAAVIDEQARAERNLRAVIEEVRAIPGFERFARTDELADIARASSGIPLAYLVNAPWGSYVLVVESPEPRVRAIAVPEPTGETVWHHLTLGSDGSGGLLMAQDAPPLTRRRHLPTLVRELTVLAPLLRPLAELLSKDPRHEIAVIPTGLLGLVPLHAVPIDDQQDTVLDDLGTLLIAPSAALLAAARVNAARPPRRVTRLVAVADPDGSLPGSRFEVAEIADIFRISAQPDGQTNLAKGPEATTAWVLDQLGDATYAHLSCHGRAPVGAHGASLSFADGPLNLDTLIKHQLAACRLLTASACQSGHYEIFDEPDQFRGLPAGLLAAGAACAVTSLWQVDDMATAVVMTRFYEYVLIEGLAPVTALRQARRWLRDLSSQDLDQYAASHPHLATLTEQYAEHLAAQGYPFASPAYWAAFTAWGI
jgi:CHAT domain-containing protein/tetratricopeptide (TPR) repeat protein